ncbi:MAG: hypothetical protein AAGG51_12595 [Cyanobacteria bacterium P01_G01_bin.54]
MQIFLREAAPTTPFDSAQGKPLTHPPLTDLPALRVVILGKTVAQASHLPA